MPAAMRGRSCAHKETPNPTSHTTTFRPQHAISHATLHPHNRSLPPPLRLLLSFLLYPFLLVPHPHPKLLTPNPSSSSHRRAKDAENAAVNAAIAKRAKELGMGAEVAAAERDAPQRYTTVDYEGVAKAMDRITEWQATGKKRYN